jgi:hypothetical protein
MRLAATERTANSWLRTLGRLAGWAVAWPAIPGGLILMAYAPDLYQAIPGASLLGKLGTVGWWLLATPILVLAMVATVGEALAWGLVILVTFLSLIFLGIPEMFARYRSNNPEELRGLIKALAWILGVIAFLGVWKVLLVLGWAS